MSWFTDKRVGEVVVFPTGMRVRIVSIRGTRVRLELLNASNERGAIVPKPHEASRGSAKQTSTSGVTSTSSKEAAHA